MKKLLSFMIILSLVFSLIPSPKAAAASPTDWWADQDAKVSPFVYSYLLNNAAFTAYLYTDTKVNMQHEGGPGLKITNRNKNFLIGEFSNGLHNFLVTADGLVVVYYPKKYAGVMRHDYGDKDILESLRSVVKIFAGPTVIKANYINFAYPESNKATTMKRGEYKITLPRESKVQSISLDNTTNYSVFNYEELPVKSLLPGFTHDLSVSWTTRIDGIQVNKYGTSSLNVFYNSESYAFIDSSHNNLPYAHYELKNKFVPFIADMTTHGAHDEVSWAVKKGLVQGYEDGTFRPENTLTESQFVSVLSKYFKINTSIDGESTDYNPDGAYIYLKQYNFPLKGYNNKDARSQPITRGTVAQVLSMSQGGPSDVRGAYNFLYNNKLTVNSTFEEYKASGSLKRSHISSFFKRMEDANFDRIK